MDVPSTSTNDDTCFICLHIGNWDQISENDTFVNVFSKGIENLFKISKDDRKDGRFLQGKTQIQTHKKSCQQYINLRSVSVLRKELKIQNWKIYHLENQN